MELKGKARADLRNEQLKRLLKAWEKRRDVLCDEISFRKGQLELLEEHIKFAYQAILDVNTEEQAKERERLAAKVEEIQKEKVIKEGEQKKEEEKRTRSTKERTSRRKENKKR